MSLLFEEMKEKMINADPVGFVENNLTLDGSPFRLNHNGYKPLVDIYRYIGTQSISPTALPVVILKSRQVGATVMTGALSLYFGCSGLFGTNGKPPMKILHAFPLSEQAQNYTKKKLNVMISTAKANPKAPSGGKIKKNVIQLKLDASVPTNDSLSFKQWVNNNTLSIESTGLDGGRLRGGSYDLLFFDEVQDIRKEAIGNTTKSTVKSPYGPKGVGAHVFFGTPLTKGSDFYRMWQQSTMNYYHLKCEECGGYFPLYAPGATDWQSVWIEDDLPKGHEDHGFMVKCKDCGCIQKKLKAIENGKWIPLAPEGSNPKFIGYHISMLLMPEFSRQRIIDELPENSAINTERTFQNEVLGEFYSGSAGPIDIETLDNKCGEVERKVVKSLPKDPNVKVYAGFDWGEKNEAAPSEDGRFKNQGKSYSCGVILTADGPELLSVQFATRLKKNDLQYKLDVVDEMFRRYNVDLAVGDIGGAGDLSDLLYQKYNNRFLPSRAVGNLKNHIVFQNDRFPPEIQFERDYHYSEIYEVMKKGLIKFPYHEKTFESIEWLLHHITQGNDIKTRVDARGELKSNFVKSGNNDGFCALLNAYLAWKFDISDGFNVRDPRKFSREKQKENAIPAVLGHFPSWRGHL